MLPRSCQKLFPSAQTSIVGAMVFGCYLSFPAFLHLRSLLWPSPHGTSSIHYSWWWTTSCKQGVVTPIRTVLTAKTGSRNFDRHFYSLTAWPHCKIALDRLTILGISWKSANDRWLRAHFVLWPIIYGRKRSDPTSSLVYGVKMSSLSCYYGVYGSDHPLCSMLLTWMCHSHTADEKVPNIPTAVEAN